MWSGCVNAPTVFAPNPLADQILRPRPDFPGALTNQNCAKYDGGQCVEKSTRVYRLDDPIFRETANKLGFTCRIGGKRYKICLDKAGFCHRVFKPKKCVLFFFCKERKLKREEYLPVSDFQFLLDADATCYDELKYEEF